MLSTVIIRALTVCVAVYIAKIAMDIIITTGWFYKVNVNIAKQEGLIYIQSRGIVTALFKALIYL
ncbi:hypothetical protein PNIG_b0575 [Pseudoalteromonas nigrifaciens]|jgi:hypothetical protein|uniref:Uncharacterized protein n=1 Tax=Pseudoalteromonas nigrifaciens TaxID=28109 RepID=A0AAC9UN74_9GAMM|nr:hypothetical protein PNIG_b0575 [Pseudoalteromonas nigrifaciens]GEN42185.1 hypothetical protein PNI02_16510 [Pseudoalteromonas nigrifaciens]|tara:strand:- start:27067 stop:27261 length:195 start_codon:yes stop_codon:yes gene_type:complete